jgi:hypothetical protein
MLPALSYSQSKSDNYPKQTVINGDTVVILKLQQAIEMNESFLELQAQIDSINAVTDTLQSVVIVKQNENKNLQYQYNIASRDLDRKYIRQHRIEVGRDIFLSVSMITGFVIVANFLNQQ